MPNVALPLNKQRLFDRNLLQQGRLVSLTNHKRLGADRKRTNIITDCSPILSFLKMETSTWRAPSRRADGEFAPVKETYDKFNRGTQRWFPPKYIENTFKAIQSTLCYLEMHSKRSYKNCICFVTLGELESFRNYRGWRVIFAIIS